MRAFIAINLPPGERQRLYDALAPLRNLGLPVRWTAAESLHLTLKFLGSIDNGQVELVQRTLADCTAGRAGFDLEIAGLGAFPGAGRPRVWWVGVRAAPELLTLQATIEGALERAGFTREDRAYAPHITIGRARDRARGSGRADGVVREFDFHARTPVLSIDLMESRPNSRGARYERVFAATLTSKPRHVENT